MSYPQPPHGQGQQFQQQVPPGQAPQYGAQPMPPYIPQPPKKKARKWPWVLGAIILLIVVISVANQNDNPETGTAKNTTAANAEQPAPAQPPAPAAAKKTVVYEVTGAGQAMSITYTTDGMTSTQQEGDVPLPWSKTIELPTGEALQMVSMIVQAGQGTTEISGKITLDGQVVKEGKSSGQFAVLSINENIGTLGR